jgi:Domain of unknown function (DUF3854)
MGESKRRRLLDANYGKSKQPYSPQKITKTILNKQTVASVYDLMIDDYELTKHHLILPPPSDQSDAADVINIIDALEKTAELGAVLPKNSLPLISPSVAPPTKSLCVDAHQNPNSQLEPRHWHEWVINSGVDPILSELNVRSLSGDEIYEYLLYALPQTARRNDGRLREGNLRRYAHINSAWWASGLDPHNDWLAMDWGRMKPDNPRLEWDKETQEQTQRPVKYESPPKTPNRVTYLRVPLHIWRLIALRYDVPMPELITVTNEGEALGFWAWVMAHPEIPVCLTEGEKKAACLLTFEFVAIALPGIWNGRVGKEDLEYLHPDLVPMAQKGRKFTILFDYETKPKTKQQIFQATRRTAATIIQLGCHCVVALLPGPEKGIDDWVVALGKKAEKAVTTMIADALTIKEYQQRFFVNRGRGLHKYKPNVIVNTRYLSTVIRSLPQSGLVGLASDMGTGKTEILAMIRYEGRNSSAIVAEFHAQLMLGQKLMMVSDSKRFIKKLEKALNDGASIDDKLIGI